MDKEYYDNIAELFVDQSKELEELRNQVEPEITIADMLTVFGHGRIGEIEFRNWLAEVYPSFKRARRADVDEWLEEKGREIAEQQEQDQSELELDEEE